MTTRKDETQDPQAPPENNPEDEQPKAQGSQQNEEPVAPVYDIDWARATFAKVPPRTYDEQDAMVTIITKTIDGQFSDAFLRGLPMVMTVVEGNDISLSRAYTTKVDSFSKIVEYRDLLAGTGSVQAWMA